MNSVPSAAELVQIQNYKVIYDFHFLWNTHAIDAGDADGGNKPKVKKHIFPIPFTGKADTKVQYIFIFLEAQS